MTQTNEKHEDKDIYTIFSYRYVLDKKNDIVNLRQDVLDLRAWPERLLGSYSTEWQRYNKRRLHADKAAFENKDIEQLVDALSIERRQELDYLLTIIEETIALVSSSNIIVIKSELKTYIENLLKI